MVYEILAAVITLVFALLVFYLIKTLKELQIFLKTTKSSIEKMNSEVAPLLKESTEIAHKLNNHIEELDPLVKSIHNVGSFLNEATMFDETHRLTTLEKKKTAWQEKIADVLVLTSMGIKFFQQFKKGR